MVVFTMDGAETASTPLDFGPPLPGHEAAQHQNQHIATAPGAHTAMVSEVSHRSSQSTDHHSFEYGSFDYGHSDMLQQFPSALLSQPLDSYLPQTSSAFGAISHDSTWLPSSDVMSATIKRSKSTPNVRGKALLDAASLAADKRRNKLGYHRTSVACGNCRRRKIRCLPAEDPNAGKCANCIRLKKDCSYFPVEQTTTERRPRACSKPEYPSGLASSQSSPSPALSGEATGESFDMSQPATPAVEAPLIEKRNRKSSVSSNGRGSRSHSRVASRRPSLARMNTAPYPVKQLDFGAPMEQVHSWEPRMFYEINGLSIDTPSLDDHQSPVIWQMTDSPLTQAPFGSVSHPSMPDLRAVSSGLDLSSGFREDVGWPLPQFESHTLAAHPLRPKQSVEFFGSHTNSPLIPDAFSMSTSMTSLVPSEADPFSPQVMDPRHSGQSFSAQALDPRHSGQSFSPQILDSRNSGQSFTAQILDRNSGQSFYMQPSWNSSFPGQVESLSKGFEATGLLYEQPLQQVVEETSAAHYIEDTPLYMAPASSRQSA